ncbi:hypothetical protein MBLNU457_4662t1 [Dothideomycetes sp. NU457]
MQALTNDTGIPLSLAVPAAAAGLAYLDARTQLSQDLDVLYATIVSGIKFKRRIKNNKTNLFHLLEEQALSSKIGHKSFLVTPPEIPKDYTEEIVKNLKTTEYTYKQTYDLVLKYANYLKQEHGVTQNDVVALDCTNQPLFVFAWFALWALGARPAFINTSLRGEGLLHCIKISECKLLLLDAQIQDALTQELSSQLEGLGVGATILDDELHTKVQLLQARRPTDEEIGNPDQLDMALLIFTSGTTGLPKAASINWLRFNSSVTLATYLHLRPDERYYSALPLYHSSGAQLAVGTNLANGSAVIISSHFSARTFFASAAASRATSMQYIGEMCRYLVSSPPTPFDKKHSIRMAFGNGIRPDVWPVFKSRFNIEEIIEFYGATESPAASFVKSRNTFHQGSIGRRGTLLQLMSRGISQLVRHDVDTGTPYRDPTTGRCETVPEDGTSVGELVMKLDPAAIRESFAGYWRNESASNSKIIRGAFVDGDAYFRTGDLMRRDRDGHTFFVDRIGDTFRWKGENVSTGEVEKVVSVDKAVEEVNVYGVELPGHDGRAGCAAVMLKEEPGKDILERLAGVVKKGLPKYAVPIFLRVVSSMETTGTSKYTKQGLRAQGVDPEKTGEDVVFWLSPQSGTYERFGKREWEGIVGGQTKL